MSDMAAEIVSQLRRDGFTVKLSEDFKLSVTPRSKLGEEREVTIMAWRNEIVVLCQEEERQERNRRASKPALRRRFDSLFEFEQERGMAWAEVDPGYIVQLREAEKALAAYERGEPIPASFYA